MYLNVLMDKEVSEKVKQSLKGTEVNEYLVSQSHYTQKYTPLIFNNDDIKVLRELAKKYAEIALLPIQDIRKKLWSDLNDLKNTRPLVHHSINSFPIN